jgi:hypothetical protein
MHGVPRVCLSISHCPARPLRALSYGFLSQCATKCRRPLYSAEVYGPHAAKSYSPGV